MKSLLKTLFQLTDLLQKPLISYMKERFSGRLVTLKPDFSVSYDMSTEQAKRLHWEVFAAGASMNLIFLDCSASCPEDLELANIHPQIIYIQITRQKVLHKLIKEMTANSKERDEQLQQAYHLYENSVSHTVYVHNSLSLSLSLSLPLPLFYTHTHTHTHNYFAKYMQLYIWKRVITPLDT